MAVYSDKVCAGCMHLKVNRGDVSVVKYTRVPEHCTNPDKIPSGKPAPVSAHAVIHYD